jgi:hypothetical protein
VEFDVVGNDRIALQALADATGGAMVLPTQHRAVDFKWPRREWRLLPWLATAGAASIAVSLIVWKRAGV